MREPIKIPIFSHTEETLQLRDMEMDYRIEDCEVVDIFLFRINAVMQDHGTGYALLLTNGDSYLSPLTVDEVLEVISKSNKGCRG